MILATVTDEMVERAEHAEAVTTAHLRTPRNYTQLEVPRRYYYGSLGEQALVGVLMKAGVRCRYHPLYDGRSDTGDVTVWLEGVGWPLDVKLASSPSYYYLMMPTARVRKPGRAIYVGVWLNDPDIEVVGFAYKHDLKPVEHWRRKVHTPIPTHAIPRDELRPIENMLVKLDRGEGDVLFPG